MASTREEHPHKLRIGEPRYGEAMSASGPDTLTPSVPVVSPVELDVEAIAPDIVLVDAADIEPRPTDVQTSDSSRRELLISVVVPSHNGSAFLDRCLAAVFASEYRRFECLVVDDSSTDDTVEIARRYSTRVLSLEGGPHGPAVARNRAAKAARGDVIFFVDADVVIRPDVLGRIVDALTRSPDVAAVFGSYDENPESTDFVSQYRNLLHHYVHQNGNEQGGTFWSGCGAVRRSVFTEMGGFDERLYSRPSIEDIELGYRIRAAGHRILLDKKMLAKHLKAWTIRSMLKADVFDRGIPWTLLILRDRNLPNDLNLQISQRLSALLLCSTLPLLMLTALFHNIAAAPLLGAFFFLTVGNWYLPKGARIFGERRRAEGLAYLVFAAIVVLSVLTGTPRILVPLAPVIVGMVVARWLPGTKSIWNRAFFAATVLGQLVAVALVLHGSPAWLLLPLVLIPAAVVLLNARFYAYLARKRGPVFALSAVPFQLLYYLYSALSFAAGVGLHYWRRSDLSNPGRRI